MRVYQQLARAVGARLRCLDSGNNEWACKWEARILEFLEDFPSGSGFDNGTKLDFDQSSGEKLVFHTAFHHMDENGMYDGWTDHTVTVTPSMELDFHLKVGGRDRNQIKDYIAECFDHCLQAEKDLAANPQS